MSYEIHRFSVKGHRGLGYHDCPDYQQWSYQCNHEGVQQVNSGMDDIVTSSGWHTLTCK